MKFKVIIMDECKVIIMGFGSVGQGVANALSMKKDLIKDKTGIAVKVVAAADSSSSAISQDGLDEELLVKTKMKKENYQHILNSDLIKVVQMFWMLLNMIVL